MIPASFRNKCWLALCLALCFYTSRAQLPQCNRIYMDQYDFGSLLSTQNIYNYNPSLPVSATNPGLNSITLPSTAANGLTVSEVLGSGNTTLTFYTVLNDRYWYYNPATAAWVNTNHTTGSGGPAVNIASGGGYIFNLAGNSGEIYRYDGTGNGSLLTTISDFSQDGPYDLIADCAGNFYLLNATGNLTTPFLRKYSSSGTLVQSWTLNNPNGYSPSGGFGIIGSNIYVDNLDPGTFQIAIASGVINATTADLTATTGFINYPFFNTVGDLGSCASGVPVLPEITISASATTVAAGTPVTFTSVINAGGSSPAYQWFVNGVPVSGATGPSYTYTPDDGDVITCRLTSNLACVTQPTSTSNAITINADGCNPAVLNFNPSVLCKGEGQAVPQFSPGGGSFSASPAGLAINNATGAINLGNSATGTYIITYSVPASSLCSARTITDTITIAAPPVAKITMTNENESGKLCRDAPVTFETPIGAGWSYNWYPDIYFPEKNNEPQVTGKAVQAGNVYVTVTSRDGCRRTDSLMLQPEPCCNVMTPTAFTPNGDGNNDEFKIYSVATQKINQLSVFNRWGERIFTSYAQDKGWDGTRNGTPADAGVYYYFLSYTCADGKLIEKKGDITLIR